MESKAMKIKTKQNIRDVVLTFISISALLILWVAVSSNNSQIFPTPSAVWERLIKMIEKPIGKTSILGHIAISMRRVLIGLSFATVLGILTGLGMGWSKKINAIISPIFTCLRPIPPIAWIPIIILWFGVGELPKVIIIFIGSYFIIGQNTAAGIAMVDPMYINVGRIYKASSWQMLMHIVFPAALPAIMAGLKIGLSSAWMVVVAAEMLASKSGLGFLITRGSDNLDTPLVMIGMICIGIVGALLSVVFGIIERRLCPWRGEENQ